MSEQKSPVWQSELEIMFQDLKQASITGELFAKKLELQGYLKALLNARLIDNEQLEKYASSIETILRNKLF